MNFSRRQLMKSAAVAAPLLSLTPGNVFGATKQGDVLRVAAIGIGGRGKSDLGSMRGHKKFKLTAACDVDKEFFSVADKFGENIPKFQDYREMFKTAGDQFDAVLVATPDHMHSPIAMLAMEHDKHIYLQKPLAQDIGECRLLAETAAKKPHLATQMGIHIHAHAAYRTAVAWIQQGLIGTVKDVHSWSGKGWGGEMPAKPATPAPENLNWDLYNGVSPYREYVEGWYHRGNWRKWFAFGTGTQGDMGCHIVDPVFTALELKEPRKVTSLGPKPFKENFAKISKVEYTFKGTQYTTDEMAMTWYNGSLRPTKLEGLPKTIKLPSQGSIFIGSKGTLVLPHIGAPQVFDTDGKKMESLPAKVPHANHFHEWIDAALGDPTATGAPFSYAGPLTEAVLMGTVINHWPEMTFDWDATNCQFLGDSEEVKQANALLRPAYRTGW